MHLCWGRIDLLLCSSVLQAWFSEREEKWRHFGWHFVSYTTAIEVRNQGDDLGKSGEEN